MRAKISYCCRKMRRASLLAGLAGGLLLVFVPEMICNDWEEQGLKGRVKTKTFYKYDILENEKVFNYKISIHYNKNGNIVRVNYYSPDEILNWIIIKEYNKIGNIIEETRYDSNGKMDWQRLYKYDTIGNKINETKNNCDGIMIEKEDYEYDDSGKMVKYVSFNRDTSLYWNNYSIVYKYDTNGNRIEKRKFYSDGRMDNIHKYDTNGNIIEMVDYSLDGSSITKFITKYYHRGNIIERLGYNLDSSYFSQKINKFNEKGKITEYMEYNRDGSLKSGKVYQYNPVNTIIENIYYRSGKPYTSRIEKNYYDKNDNLIETKAFFSDTLAIHRKYRYNENNQKIEEFHKTPYYNFDFTVKYKYDNKGNEISKETYLYDGKFINILENEYDETGNKAEFIKYTIDFRYDEEKKILEEYKKYEYEYYD